MNNKIEHIDYVRCQKSPTQTWIGRINGLEINLLGGEDAPSTDSLKFLSAVWSKIQSYENKAKEILKELAAPSGEWIFECLVVDGHDNCIHLEFSNEDDFYGLWSVIYRNFGKPEVGEMTRIQT